jgi:hypothetical protein
LGRSIAAAAWQRFSVIIDDENFAVIVAFEQFGALSR